VKETRPPERILADVVLDSVVRAHDVPLVISEMVRFQIQKWAPQVYASTPAPKPIDDAALNAAALDYTS
jgi:hypothetical protein